MYWFIITYTISVLILGLISYLLLFHVKFKDKRVPILLFASYIIIGVASFITTGFPRPAHLMLLMDSSDTQVISHKLVQNEAIYLWVSYKGTPFSLVLPWNDKQAKELAKGERVFKQNGTRMLLVKEKGSQFAPGKWVFKPNIISFPEKP